MIISQNEIGDILNGLSRVIKFYARMYEGKGVERDDLVQEGFLAAVNLIRRHSRASLDHALKTSLRGMVRDAAKRLRRGGGALQMSICAGEDDEPKWLSDFIADARAEEEVENVELMYDMDRLLDPGEKRIAIMLLEGYTHAEVGLELEISQQAASKRIEKMRCALQPLRERYC